MAAKRIRIFAGPNGSGKSTLFKILSGKNVDLGIFVNADEILKSIIADGQVDLSQYFIRLNFLAFCDSYKGSSRFRLSNGEAIMPTISSSENRVIFSDTSIINSYFAAFIADYIRDEMLNSGTKFTTETVMSHISKLDYIKKSKDKGYRVYLYFVSTRDPKLNIERVKQRVLQQGHNVPHHKIIDRYYRSLENLFDAIKLSDRAYIFDNSEAEAELYLEYNAANDNEIKLPKEYIPAWIKEYVIDKISM